MARFVVSGEQNGVHVSTVYKSKAAALKFAKTLTNVEVYDRQTKDYLYGTTKFYNELVQHLTSTRT